MRRNSLGALIQMLRRELGVAESPALGRNTREAHAQALRSAQERLYQAWDWPFKKIYRDEAMYAGERYYKLHEDMDIENIREVKCLNASQWQCVTRGICSDDYDTINSDADVRQDPVWKWDHHNDPDTNDAMFEVWPIPLTTGYSKLRFYGIKKLSPLLMDKDLADLDDLALVLTAAADLTTTKDRQAAQTKADRHVFMLARNLNNSRTFVSGGGEDPQLEQYRPPPIVIAQ